MEITAPGSMNIRNCWKLMLTVLLTICPICSTQEDGLLDVLRLFAHDPSLNCDEIGGFAEFDGGTAFFQKRFEPLYESILQATQTINKLNVSRRVSPRNEVYSASSRIDSLIESGDLIDIQVLMGLEADSLVYCFKDFSFAQCESEQESLYLLTSSLWSYRHYCNKWSAIYTSVQTRILTRNSYIKTIIRVEIDISSLKIDQCVAYTEDEFAETHLCPSNTQCLYNPDTGFGAERYVCSCNDCRECANISGTSLLNYWKNNGTEEYGKEACTMKAPVKPMLVTWEQPGQILIGLLVINAICVLLCIILAIVVLSYHESKSIMSAKPLILELILIGAIIIYATLLLRCFSASMFICMLGPWLREVAFVCIYGAILLKTYKGLAEFQTRKARRVHVRDKDLLKYWFSMLAILIIYMSSWSAINVHYISEGSSMLTMVQHSTMCAATPWNHVTEASELILLAIGIYMSYRLRSASSLFWESRFFAAAFCIEFVISLLFYIVSHHFQLLYYDWVPFLHTQLTITPVLLIVFLPKLHYIRCPPPDSAFYGSKCNNTTDLVDFRTPNKSLTTATNGEVDIDDINIAEMSPDDIRRELRRVYEQLQMYKVKVMRYENPHIQHKRGKLPFYKQITKHGFSKKHQSEHHDVPVSENPEEVPLTSVTPADQTNAASF